MPTFVIFYGLRIVNLSKVFTGFEKKKKSIPVLQSELQEKSSVLSQAIDLGKITENRLEGCRMDKVKAVVFGILLPHSRLVFCRVKCVSKQFLINEEWR